MPRDTSSLFDYPFSADDLLLAAAVLLVLAAFLLVSSRRCKIVLRHSELTAVLKQPTAAPPLQTLGNDPNTVRYPLDEAEIPRQR
jgi:hypothetical protein